MRIANAIRLMKRPYIVTMISDFSGKVSGSVVENPNMFKQGGSASLNPPSTMVYELPQTYVDRIKVLDSICSTNSQVGSGVIAQQLFQFNLIAIAEKQLGTSIGVDTASKVQWLKDNLNKIICNWYGYGSSPLGNKAIFTQYVSTFNEWHGDTKTNTSTSPTLLSKSLANMTGNSYYSLINAIDTNGFAHFLAYTDASDGVTPSTIYTDYISLTITFKN